MPILVPDHQLAQALFADGEEMFAVQTGDGTVEAQGPGGEPFGVRFNERKIAAGFRDRPEIGSLFDGGRGGLEDVMPAIGRPIATAFVRWVVPTWK